MNCETARQLWHDRYDGELGTDAEASLDVHLLGCTTCRRYHAEMDHLATGLERLRTLTEVSQSATPDQPMPTEPARSRTFSLLSTIGRVAAAILLFAGGSLYLNARFGIDRIGAPPERGFGRVAVSEADRAAASIQLLGESASKYLVVAKQSSDPRVHVFRLYGTYSPEGR